MHTAPDTSFGARLQSLRHAAGLSAAELAARVGLKGRDHIHKLEAGTRQPSYGMLRRLAEALGCDLAAFFDPPAT